jgi:hypothetical protein
MNHTFKTLSLTVLSFSPVFLFGCSTAIDPAAAEKEVRQQTDQMVEAWRLNDQDWLERNAVNEYLITSQSLEVVNKEQIIEYMSGAEEDPDPGTAQIDDWQTIANGDTVISLYKLTWTFDSGKSNEVLVTDVWSRDAAQWKLLTQHVSRISLTGPADSDTEEE